MLKVGSRRIQASNTHKNRQLNSGIFPWGIFCCILRHTIAEKTVRMMRSSDRKEDTDGSGEDVQCH